MIDALYLFDGREVTFADFIDADNDPVDLAAIASLAVGESITLGMCDDVERIR